MSNDPFASLATKARRVTPRRLTGNEKVLWNKFKAKYHNGEFNGLPMADLFEWAKEHCGLTCSVSCFRAELLEEDQ